MLRPLAALCCVAAVALAAPAASSATEIGIGDQQAAMFANPLFQALDVPIVRYIAPYDAMAHGVDARNADAFIRAAQLSGKQVLVAFYHSRYTPERLPSSGAYTSAVRQFIQAFPYVREYQAWNRPTAAPCRAPSRAPARGPPPPTTASCGGSAPAARSPAWTCWTASNLAPSLAYLRQFQRYARPAPTIWGLHNYSDTNRHSTSRTRAFLRAVRGQVWLTETGGIVKFGASFPGGSKGQARAARALRQMFKIADISSRIRRLYIFQWTGAPASARFDAGLTNPNGTARPGYRVVRSEIGG